jgi:hypothetical protein
VIDLTLDSWEDTEDPLWMPDLVSEDEL